MDEHLDRRDEHQPLRFGSHERLRETLDALEVAIRKFVCFPLLRRSGRTDNEIEGPTRDLLDVRRVEESVECVLLRQVPTDETGIPDEGFAHATLGMS